MGVRHPEMFLSVGFNRAPGIFLSFGSYVGYDPTLLALTFAGFVNAHVLAPLRQDTFGFFCLYVKTRLRGAPQISRGTCYLRKGWLETSEGIWLLSERRIRANSLLISGGGHATGFFVKRRKLYDLVFEKKPCCVAPPGYQGGINPDAALAKKPYTFASF